MGSLFFAAHGMNQIMLNAVVVSVREYVFYVFFQITKNMTFYVFLK